MCASASRRSTLILLALSLLGVHVAAAETAWTEIRSPHFRVLTDASARDGRRVAREFEQMRYVFALRFNNAQIESGAPLTIVAARDAATFKSLEPAVWKNHGENVAGLFHRGWEKQFAVIRQDTWGDNGEVVVYHEYTHSIMHANAHWLPVWLDEGLAEFYAYTRFQGDRIYVGAPSRRMGELRSRTLIPVTTMLDVTPRSPYYHEGDKVQLFYAESWAMVHFMSFGPNMENGAKLNKFFHLIGDRVPQQQAFRDTFGDPHAFDEAFRQYVSRFAFLAATLAPDQGADQNTFAERKLSPAEADYELGCLQIGAHDRVLGKSLLESSLTLDPRLAGAHEELGFLNFDQGDDAAAVSEWKQALALDPARSRALFALTMSGPPFASQSRQDLVGTQIRLRHVTELAPQFAPAYVELALIEWRQGSLQQAYKDAHQAETLEPWRAGYRLLTGRILLAGHQPALAASYSRYVATQYFGPDHNEAVDLWKAIPAAQQGDGPPLALDLPAGAQIARGTLTAVSCEQEARSNKISFTFLPEAPAGAAPLTLSGEKSFMSGFSDTLWWGEDHFSLCHHLAGLSALVAYKPQGPGGAGDLLDLEVRDALPESSQTATMPPAKTAASAATPAAP